MEYYEVWVRSYRYRNDGALTYSSDKPLAIGTLVTVPLQHTPVPAVVIAKVRRPNFACKPISIVHDLPPLPARNIKLIEWLQAYYPSPLGPLLQLFLPGALPKTAPESSATSLPEIADLPLTSEQAAAVEAINDQPGTFVLHGRTGSGKTRVYAALASQAIQHGKSVIILCPEISLTPQLARSMQTMVSAPIVTIHSKMTIKQRSEAWVQTLQAMEPQVIIGPRSALFMPLKEIGLIVIDESHEPAYKQEQQPYYYTPRVAAQLAHLHHATLVLGSATPSVSEYFLAEQKHRPILELPNLAIGSAIPVTKIIVDLKDRDVFSASPHLSDPLIAAITSTLARQEQTMLYLNRRGTARLALCRSCGWQASCPHCDLPLAYHSDTHQLLCHTCGYHTASPSFCPVCQNTDIIFKSAGTKAIFEEVQRLFPEARIMRFDTDNKKSERLEQHYDTIHRGDVDILVGTQLLAKGLDLPKLTTLGIVLADSSLAIPDFTAQERTYQLIQQVMGRIGRGHSTTAQAIVQTYNPDNQTLQSALSGDWGSFYETEIAERRAFMFPPFCHLLKLSCRRASSVSAQKAAEALRSELLRSYTHLEVDGPTPAFHEKSAGKYEWQLVLKSKQRSVLLTVVKNLPKSGWNYDIDPLNLL